jgi:hypothetical protein
MIKPEDVAGAVRWLLTTSPQCVVPEIQFTRPGDNEQSPPLIPPKQRARRPAR